MMEGRRERIDSSLSSCISLSIARVHPSYLIKCKGGNLRHPSITSPLSWERRRGADKGGHSTKGWRTYGHDCVPWRLHWTWVKRVFKLDDSWFWSQNDARPRALFQIYFVIVILMPRNLQDLCPIWQVSIHNTISTSALRLCSPPSTAMRTLSMPSTAGLGPADQHKVL